MPPFYHRLPYPCASGTVPKLSQDPSSLVQQPAVEVSLPHQPAFDDLYEYYDPERDPTPQRQQQITTPTSQRRPQSAQSSGARSLRRTPRLQERRVTTRSPLRARRSQPLSTTPPVQFDESGSTTPSFFQRLVSDDVYRPRRSLHVSRHTHDAILFALEAIRRGDGVHAQPLTADPLEEEARMSDLVRGTAPGTAAVSSRTQNGGATRAAAAAGTGPTPSEPPRYRTPTDVMRDRRAREARRAEEAAARLRQEEEARRLQEEQVVGVGDDTARRPAARPSAQPQIYNIGGAIPQPTGPTSRRQENIPPAQPSSSRTAARAPDPVAREPRISAATQRNRTEAYEQLSIPAPAKPAEQVPRPSQPPQPQPRTQTVPQSGSQPVQQPAAQVAAAAARSRFPNAFERWEDLSARWEGIVSSFIHRMENNADELAGKPLDRQMARQIDDLSRAGANLFHAVVELQRLRASSERKFQRWFFETRHEQEQAQERQAELERQLRAEREARTLSSTSIEQVRAERTRAEELVKEMRRELQISKEEARRAWEELGRREQEERERTIALRSGEPTLIGGVQVVPMQGLPSRQVSTAQRPQTRDGPTGGAGPTTMSGQQPQQRPHSRQTTTTSLDSPGEESRQFTFRPDTGNSSNITDPFTESSRQREQQTQLRREPDTQFYTTPPRPTQAATSGAAIAAARAAASGGQSPGRTPGESRYQPTATTDAQMSGALPTPVRQGTGGTEQSFMPSNASLAPSEEEYHINPDGSYTRDSQGRRIPYRQPLGLGTSGLAGEISDDEGEIPEGISEDDDDHAADAERERLYAAQYRQPQSSQQPPTTSGGIPRTTSGALPPIPQGRTLDPPSSPYEGQGYDPSVPPAVTQAMTGWESLQTRGHQHPTRLSDIIEEQTARTSPSRTSYVSGSGVLPGDHGNGTGPTGTGNGGGNSSSRR
ncbi:hypothetical protein AYL99_07206 [Fonsecaea erecta]|uniref:Uncharacterized protein n=1 Tax=Fonsecaea erecta TaxID=1367422 RepID=A0A178ZF58_9EURO|nr:hypothetical protein AYL99_07206 [Fonsecaea erecta]OAP58116.1 hypothetical protein AYL99_07206 [Fonsecaea erecta]